MYRLATAQGDSLLLAEAYYLYGKRYASVGQHLTAKRWFLRSLRIQEKRGDVFEHGRLYMRLADIEADQWNQAAALHYNRHALAIFRRIPDYKGLTTVACRLAHMHLGDHPASDRTDHVRINIDSAQYYLLLADRWSSFWTDSLQLADRFELRGKILLKRGQPEAIQYLKRSTAIHQQLSTVNVQIRSKIHLVLAHLTLGRPDAAYPIADSLWQVYNRSPNHEYDVRIMIEAMMMAYYEAVGDWQRAYVHQRNMRLLEKSGMITDRNGAITRLSVEYETAKKDAQLQANKRELALQKANLRNEQRFTRAMVALLILAVGGIIIFFRLYRQKNRLSRRNAELVKEQNHRVKNNLQVVSSLLNLYAHRLTDPISKMAVEESQLRVETMALLQRQLYDRDRLTTIDLAAFLPELVEGVLHTYGFGTLQPDYQVDECEMMVDQALPIGLIVNEIVTNACKYAFPGQPQPAFSLTLHRQGQRVELTVVDNGPGLPAHLLNSNGHVAGLSDSFGLQLIDMQVEQIEGSYRWLTHQGTQFSMNFTIHT